jgi:MHS family alpha-ketoglutarate permease-like MFS transporter
VDSVALGFKNAGHETWFFWYATACIFVSLLFYLFMRTRGGIHAWSSTAERT